MMKKIPDLTIDLKVQSAGDSPPVLKSISQSKHVNLISIQFSKLHGEVEAISPPTKNLQ